MEIHVNAHHLLVKSMIDEMTQFEVDVTLSWLRHRMCELHHEGCGKAGCPWNGSELCLPITRHLQDVKDGNTENWDAGYKYNQSVVEVLPDLLDGGISDNVLLKDLIGNMAQGEVEYILYELRGRMCALHKAADAKSCVGCPWCGSTLCLPVHTHLQSICTGRFKGYEGYELFYGEHYGEQDADGGDAV